MPCPSSLRQGARALKSALHSAQRTARTCLMWASHSQSQSNAQILLVGKRLLAFCIERGKAWFRVPTFPDPFAGMAFSRLPPPAEDLAAVAWLVGFAAGGVIEGCSGGPGSLAGPSSRLARKASASAVAICFALPCFVGGGRFAAQNDCRSICMIHPGQKQDHI